jgi:hypothetical protein
MDGRNRTAWQDGGDQEASQHAATTYDGEPEQQQKTKLKLQLILQHDLRHEPKPIRKPTPIPGSRWETVKPRTQSQTASAGPCCAPIAGPSRAEKPLTLLRNLIVPPPNKMDQDIASALIRALFRPAAAAHIRIMNTRRNSCRTVSSFLYPLF